MKRVMMFAQLEVHLDQKRGSYSAGHAGDTSSSFKRPPNELPRRCAVGKFPDTGGEGVSEGWN